MADWRGEYQHCFLHSWDASSGGVNSSTIVTSFGTKEALRQVEKVMKNKGAGAALVQTLAVPCVSYLFQRNDGKAVSEDEQSSWLADLLRPINVNFGRRDGTAAATNDARRNGDCFNESAKDFCRRRRLEVFWQFCGGD